MKPINERLGIIQKKIDTQQKVKIMIIGLGSVGTYLLDYLVSANDAQIEIVVAGRNYDKMVSDVNIIRTAALIRKLNKTHITIDSRCDLEDILSIQACMERHCPDFIVNSSRVYAGLKYGSISWHTLRAYGVWSPLAIRYIRNIMQGYALAKSDAVVINTSYSDAVIPWLKSANQPSPDFGSGNLNHLIPRIKFAVAEMLQISDFWNIEVAYATAHFHDVVISKEGHVEGVEQLLKIYYNDKEVTLPQDEIFRRCKIAMPVDAKRNMMNASSNYDIIATILKAIRQGSVEKFNSPGAFGEIGGYPVKIDCSKGYICAAVDEDVFCLEQMREYNRISIYLDGIEKIENGVLFYTPELVKKVKIAFGVNLPQKVDFNEIDKVATFLIDNIIKKSVG